MKKTLLFLGLLGLASQAQAQGPWTLVNTANSNIFGQYNVVDVHTLSPTLMWGVTSERSATATIPNTFIVTNNSTGAGDQYDFSTVTVTGNATVGNISGISASTAVAAVYPGSTFTGGTNYGGEILKTINGGQNWLKKTTAAHFTGPGTFCNWVHMFNSTTGVALGDPATAGGGFEILRTTDGGENWNRLTSGVPAALPDEYGNAGSFFASNSAPGTLWTGLASSNGTNTVRIFKTTDFGLTWVASGLIPNIVGAVSQLAFKDNNLDGIAYGFTIVNSAITALNVAKTTDGGMTWTAITPNNTAAGSFFRNSIDAVGNTFYSTGPRYAVAPSTQVPEDFGFSSSTDGINWTNITVSGTSLSTPGYFFCMDLIPTASPNTVVGHGGLYTDPSGAGGVYKYSRTALATRDAGLQSSLNVYPNPSTSGVFKVDLGSDLKAGAKLTVVDALGRQVAGQTLTASAIGSRTISLDLSGEKTGVYTLQVRTDAGIATQKVVID
ncbi:T9SS type A sorting domain-containing protein [Hymenobacter negativus]|uniref:T9SS type A sorting domain-containing protein n=1 Tax=Hymenobacter negativus TaxID=2795026 RepID=A0ABS3QD93_9BACT|nr:T9SS type A sorting domain-containing protein [Hymenobacter negativus]MBO2009212.1 T9SS type A sorting domain-containing protein [Hymenobacter negativus]